MRNTIRAMHRRLRFQLYPDKEQVAYFLKCDGAARHAWNWGIRLRERYYKAFGKTLSHNRLLKQWNKHKRGKKAWASKVGKVATSASIIDLDVAYRRFFSDLSRHPKPKKKHGRQPSFAIADMGRDIRFQGNNVQLPVVGKIRYRGRHKYDSNMMKSATVLRAGGRWFLSVLYKLPDPKPSPHTGPTCGIDLGCNTFAVIASEGKIVGEVKSPKPYAKSERKLKRLQRKRDRRTKDGKNHEKAKKAVSVLYWRITNIRNDFLHKLSRSVVNTFSRVTLEDLCVVGLARGFARKSIGDLGFGEFRRQVEYKAAETATVVVLADRYFPSSKICSSCSSVKTKLKLQESIWTCDGCGVTHHRDHNAAFNLEKLPQGMGKVTPAEIGGSSTGDNTPREVPVGEAGTPSARM